MILFKLVNFNRFKKFIIFFFNRPDLLILKQKLKYIFRFGDSSSIKLNKNHKNIFFFPVIDWWFRFQRPQHFASALANNGYRIFYLSTILNNNAFKIFREKRNIYLVQFSSKNFIIPNLYKETLSAEDIQLIKKNFDLFCKKFNINKFNIIVQHPYWWPLVSKLNSGKIIYDCLDLHSGFYKKKNPELIKNEKLMLKKADKLIFSSLVLKKLSKKKNSLLIRNGCEYKLYDKLNSNTKDNSIIVGYVGSISHWFDIKLISYLALNQPDWNFKFYGAVDCKDAKLLRSFSNVKFFNEISYEKVPEIISTFNVGIIPFKINNLTLAVNPVKVYEYLAAGKPVISTMLPELQSLNKIDVFCCKSKKDFLLGIKIALKISNNKKRINIRKRWAKTNDWSIRVSKLEKIL